MAYRKKIYTPICDCGKKATYEVFAFRNQKYGPKCSACSTRLVSMLTADERVAARQAVGEKG
jgi:hypothetical protein